MSVEKTIVWENEKWRLTQYFDGVWMLKSKDGLNSVKYPDLDIALDYEEIITLKEILSETKE